jgi:hypothetical protein
VQGVCDRHAWHDALAGWVLHPRARGGLTLMNFWRDLTALLTKLLISCVCTAFRLSIWYSTKMRIVHGVDAASFRVWPAFLDSKCCGNTREVSTASWYASHDSCSCGAAQQVVGLAGGNRQSYLRRCISQFGLSQLLSPVSMPSCVLNVLMPHHVRTALDMVGVPVACGQDLHVGRQAAANGEQKHVPARWR